MTMIRMPAFQEMMLSFIFMCYVPRPESFPTRILSVLLGAQFRHLGINRRELKAEITSFRQLQTIPIRVNRVVDNAESVA